MSTGFRAVDRFSPGSVVSTSRSDVAAAQHRSILNEVDPTRLPDPPLVGFDPDSRLMQAAQPVLSRMVDTLGTTDVAIVLADSRAAIVRSVMGQDRRLIKALEAIGGEPGMVRDEEAIGANGLGTVLEIRRPILLVGDDHFHERLQPFACAGVQICNPTSNRLEGVLTLACRAGDANPMMLSWAQTLAQSIERRLRSLSTRVEQALFDEFVRWTRTPASAVVALNQEFILANSQAAQLLTTEDHARLWEWAVERLPDSDRMRRSEIQLGCGITYRARCSAITLDGATVGAVVSLRLATDPTRALESPDTAEWSRIWARTMAQVNRTVGLNRVTVIRGEPGTGKRTLAAAASEAAALHAATIVIAPPGNAQDADVERVRTALAAGRNVILARIQHLTDDNAADLATTIAGSQSTVALAGPRDWGHATAGQSALFHEAEAVVDVPPLRDHLGDIPALAARMLAGPGQLTREALSDLMRRRWPGNLGELRRVVSTAALTAMSDDIGLHDLPAASASMGRASDSPLRETEKDVIVAALRASNWNKSTTANYLGIGRSTLYRKMREYSIRPPTARPQLGP